jgi:hypothetical protein
LILFTQRIYFRQPEDLPLTFLVPRKRMYQLSNLAFALYRQRIAAGDYPASPDMPIYSVPQV